MKKLFFLIVIIFQIQLFSFSSCYCQDYKSIFGKQFTSWKLTFCNLNVSGYDSLYVNGDTLVENKTYKKVYNYNIFYGGVREDTVLGQAWWKTLNKNFIHDTAEILIMNMQLSVGDSFNFNVSPSYPGNNNWIRVTDTYFKSGSKYIVFNKIHGWSDGGILFNDTLTFIEGVGPNYSVMYLMYGSLNGCQYVICSYKDDLLYYSTTNKDFSNCLLNPQPGIVECNNNEYVEIFPNPSNNKLNIEFNSSGQICNSATLQIYNLQGQKEFERLMTKPKEQIDVSNLAEGVYFIKIKNETGVTVTKFIKQ